MIRTLLVSVGEAGSGADAVFTYHVRLDGAVLAANQSLTVPQSRGIRELSQQYGELFERGGPPQLAREKLIGFGGILFDAWLELDSSFTFHDFNTSNSKHLPAGCRVYFLQCGAT